MIGAPPASATFISRGLKVFSISMIPIVFGATLAGGRALLAWVGALVARIQDNNTPRERTASCLVPSERSMRKQCVALNLCRAHLRPHLVSAEFWHTTGWQGYAIGLAGPCNGDCMAEPLRRAAETVDPRLPPRHRRAQG